jgi:hypothetical protein
LLIRTTERNAGDKKAMRNMMTPEEAYDKGLYQVYLILDRDRKARIGLGLKPLHEAAVTPKRGRMKK